MSKNKSFVIGQTVTLTAEFKVNSVLTNPSTVAVTVESPDGTQTTPSVTSVSTGIRSATVVADEEGYWKYRWVSTGTAAGVQEGTFYIASSALS